MKRLCGWPLMLGMMALLLPACRIRPAVQIELTLAATPQLSLPGATPMSPAPAEDLEPTVMAADVPQPESTPTETYVVQPGDTLLGLATQWQVPMAAIQQANGMADSTVVKVGVELSIPFPEGWEEATRFWILHVVKEDETLSHIARRYELTVARLQEVNGLSGSEPIRVGQELILPLDTLDVTPVPTPTATPLPPTPTMTPVASPTTAITATSIPSSETVLTPTASPSSSSAAVVAEPMGLNSPPAADVVDWPRETVRLINEVRAQHGLPPYAYNETLAQAAQAHANDCANRGWCSHTGSDGASIKDRVRRIGYDGAGWAECWAQRQTPRGAVDVWMDEQPPNDPHRRTLLHAWFTEVGLGVAQTTWGYYFIADFGRP